MGKERLRFAIIAGIVAFILGSIKQKYGVGGIFPPTDSVSWQEFFVDRIDSVVIGTVIVFVGALILYRLFKW